jgi:hypothetical protein
MRASFLPEINLSIIYLPTKPTKESRANLPHLAMGSLFFPVLGVILSNALYFSSTPVIIQASRRGTLGSLNPLPLALMVVSTVSWMCYAC